MLAMKFRTRSVMFVILVLKASSMITDVLAVITLTVRVADLAVKMNTPFLIHVKDHKTQSVFRVSAAQAVNGVTQDAVLKTLFVRQNLVTTTLADPWNCTMMGNGDTFVRKGLATNRQNLPALPLDSQEAS